jgi:hypothetical protein
MVNQKEACYAAVKAWLQEKGIHHDDGEHLSLSKDAKREIVEMITQAAVAGEMEFSEAALIKMNTVEKLRNYCSSLLSNWLRKDTRLNGSVAYVPKNPGTKTGQTDEVVRNLRALRAKLTEESHLEAIDAQIQKRLEELRTAKTQQVAVDFNKIPVNIRNLFIGK